MILNTVYIANVYELVVPIAGFRKAPRKLVLGAVPTIFAHKPEHSKRVSVVEKLQKKKVIMAAMATAEAEDLNSEPDHEEQNLLLDADDDDIFLRNCVSTQTKVATTECKGSQANVKPNIRSKAVQATKENFAKSSSVAIQTDLLENDLPTDRIAIIDHLCTILGMPLLKPVILDFIDSTEKERPSPIKTHDVNTSITNLDVCLSSTPTKQRLNKEAASTNTTNRYTETRVHY